MWERAGSDFTTAASGLSEPRDSPGSSLLLASRTGVTDTCLHAWVFHKDIVEFIPVLITNINSQIMYYLSDTRYIYRGLKWP